MAVSPVQQKTLYYLIMLVLEFWKISIIYIMISKNLLWSKYTKDLLAQTLPTFKNINGVNCYTITIFSSNCWWILIKQLQEENDKHIKGIFYRDYLPLKWIKFKYGTRINRSLPTDTGKDDKYSIVIKNIHSSIYYNFSPTK